MMIRKLAIILGVLLLSACIPEQSPEEFVRNLQPVQLFLEQHPNAVLHVVKWDLETLHKNKDFVFESCKRDLPEEELMFVSLEENGAQLFMWTEVYVGEGPICTMLKGSGNPPPVPTEPTLAIDNVIRERAVGEENTFVYHFCINATQDQSGYDLQVGTHQLFGFAGVDNFCPQFGAQVFCAGCVLQNLHDDQLVTITDGIFTAQKTIDFNDLPVVQGIVDHVDITLGDLTYHNNEEETWYYLCMHTNPSFYQYTFYDVYADGQPVGLYLPRKTNECEDMTITIPCNGCVLDSLTQKHLVEIEPAVYTGFDLRSGKQYDFSAVRGEIIIEPSPGHLKIESLSVKFVFPGGIREYTLCFDVDDAHIADVFILSADGRDVYRGQASIRPDCDRVGITFRCEDEDDCQMQYFASEHQMSLLDISDPELNDRKVFDFDQINQNSVHPESMQLQSMLKYKDPSSSSAMIYEACFKGGTDVATVFDFYVDQQLFGTFTTNPNTPCPNRGVKIPCDDCLLNHLAGSHPVWLEWTHDKRIDDGKDIDFDSIPDVSPTLTEPSLRVQMESLNGYFDVGPAGFQGYVLCFDTNDDIPVEDITFTLNIDGRENSHTGLGIGQAYNICNHQSFGIMCERTNCDLPGTHDVVLTAETASQEVTDRRSFIFNPRQTTVQPNAFHDDLNSLDGWTTTGPDHVTYHTPVVSFGIAAGYGSGYSDDLEPWPAMFKPITIDATNGFTLEFRAVSGTSWPNAASVYLYMGESFYQFRVYGESSNYNLDWYTYMSDGTEKEYRYNIGPGVLDKWHTYKLTRDDQGSYALYIDEVLIPEFAPPSDEQLSAFDHIGIMVAREASKADFVKLSGS